MGMYCDAESYLQLDVNWMLLKLTADDKEPFAYNLCVFKPFDELARVNINIINIRLVHKQAILDYLEEKFGLKQVWIERDSNYRQDNSGIMGNLNIVYKVPVDLIGNLAVLYKLTM